LFGGVFADVFGDLHRAKVRAAHGAEVRGLCAFLRQGFIVEFARGDGVEAEVELIFPAEFKARFAQRVVAVLRAGMAFGEVGGVGGDLVGDDAVFHVLLVRQAEVFLGRDVAEHRASIPTDHRRADAAGDVVVVATSQAPPQRRRAQRFWNSILTGCLSGGERPERVERCFAAPLELLGHVFLDHVHGRLAATWFNLGKTFQIQLAEKFSVNLANASMQRNKIQLR